MYIATLNLTDEEVHALMKIKAKKNYQSIDLMLTGKVKEFIASENPVKDPNQSEIQLDG